MTGVRTGQGLLLRWWQVLGSNQHRLSRRFTGSPSIHRCLARDLRILRSRRCAGPVSVRGRQIRWPARRNLMITSRHVQLRPAASGDGGLGESTWQDHVDVEAAFGTGADCQLAIVRSGDGVHDGQA